MTEKNLTFTVEEIIGNPFYVCDFILIKEQREKLFKLENKELIKFMALLSQEEITGKVATIINNGQYDKYLKSKVNPSSLDEELKAIGVSIAQSFGQAALLSGIPIPLVEIINAIKKKFKGGKGEKLVEVLIIELSQENVRRRLKTYIESEDITHINLNDY
ncbi:hypothetical protein J7J00_17630 [Bacillus sp. ISL-4]|uniref:hypothetical protein n=1 Tax=Bacillus sp. ISL-4 TaxID=2819125 RepID=UPI001BE7174D|nr:hypothetical protein [Bacillus sp. ISL-4]MBT2667303.1 hypothetical protein [Bacillus sp. ISL-4]MBT2674179.1 hypothetical protein [Streptomyces sp. ISL-14]